MFQRLRAKSPPTFNDRSRIAGIEFSISDGLEADADARLPRIVIENLFGNAWKFTRDVELPKVEFGLDADGTSYFIRDNGAGFNMTFADKLFRPFQRLIRRRNSPAPAWG
jgi:light-regulated signal transduction histidine kinase (bacteriophytochrome)